MGAINEVELAVKYLKSLYLLFFSKMVTPLLRARARFERSHRRAGIGAYFLKMTHARIAARTAEQIERAPCLAAREDGAGCLTLAHVGGFAAHQEVLARRCEEIDHLSVFAKPCLVLRTSRNEHDVARTANSLFRCRGEIPSCP